jgi:hypothetical protein
MIQNLALGPSALTFQTQSAYLRHVLATQKLLSIADFLLSEAAMAKII